MKLLNKVTVISAGILMLAGNGLAAKAEGYKHTITFDPGAGYGVVTGTESTKDYDHNDTVSFAGVRCDVPVDSEYYGKYIFRGWHESGVEALATLPNTVTEDVVFVASYTIVDNLVSYTVTYTTADGTELAPSETYYGNVGDKPVLPYLYIEGYIPRDAYNLTKELKSDSSENVFAFIYVPITPSTSGEGGTTYTYVDEGGTVTYVTVPGGGGGGGAAAGGGGAAVVPGGGAGPAPAVIPDDQTPAAEPEPIIDIDEPETPAGGFSPAPTSTAEVIPEPGTPGGGISNAWKIALATGGGIALLLLLLLLLRRKDNAQ